MKRILLILFLITFFGFSNRITAQAAYLDISPNSQNVSESAGSVTFSVNVNVGWNVTDDAAWLTATKTDGSTITVTYEENTSTYERTANITATGTGDVTETVTLTQVAKTPYLDVTPNSKNVSLSAGSTTFTVNANVGWNVTDDAAWLTAVKTDGSTITISYDENTSTSERTAHITTSGTGGVTETVTLTQAGITPRLEIYPKNLTVCPTTGYTTFSVDANVGWNVTDDAAWLTAEKTDGSTITVTYEANTNTSERIASITATGTEGVTETVTLTQMQCPTVSPSNRDVSPASGSTNFDVTMSYWINWSLTEDATWLTATKSNDNTIYVIYDKNSSGTSRTATITLSLSSEIFATVTVTQAATTSYLNVSPNSQDVGISAGSTTFSVNTNVEWSVTDDADWLSANKTHGNNISVSYDENNSTYDRTANITVTGTGRLSETVTVTQAGGTPYLDVSPNIYIVGGLAGSVTFSVSASVGWSVTDDADWLTATKTDGSTITVNYEENSLGYDRAAHITASGTGGVSETVTLTQESSVVVAYIGAGPGNRNVSSASGSTTFRVIASGNAWDFTPANDGATWLNETKSNDTTITATYDENTSGNSRIGKICVTVSWMSGETIDLTVTQSETSAYLDVFPASKLVGKAPGSTTFSVSTNIEWDVTDDVTWLTAKKIDASTFIVAYEDNTSAIERTASITVTGAEGISETISVTQAGETPYLDIFPTSKLVGKASGSTTFSVSTNTAWSVADDADWLTATKTDASTITVAYEENTSAIERTAHITVTGTGGITKTITVTQTGGTSYFDVSPDSKSVDASAGSTPFSVSTNVTWSVTEDADWLTATKTDGSTFNVTYDENPDPYNSRTANITVNGSEGKTEIVTLTQGANVDTWYLAQVPTSKNVSSDPGTTTFSIHTNLQWSVTDDADWLIATKSNDSTITVTYEENTSTSERTAMITAKGVSTSGGLDPMVLCTVTQAGVSSYLDVSPNNQSVGLSAGSTSFSVSCNKAWSVTDDADWLTATKSNDSTISVTYDENTSSNSRKAYIEATSNDAEISLTVTVIQAGTSPYLDVFPDIKAVDAAAGSTTFSVSSNVSWSVNEDADWLTATKTDEGTITVTYDANTSTDVRGVDIMITGTGVTDKAVELMQTGTDLYLNVSPNDMVVGASAGSTTITVISNVEWSLANDAYWLAVTMIDGSTIVASYDPNASLDPRTVSFTVTGTGGIADTVTITQEGEYIYLDVDPESIRVSADSGDTTFTVSTNVEAMEWSIEQEAPWLTAVQTDDSIISISYDANTATGPRTAPVTAFVIYADVSRTVTITQDGAAAYLDVSPNTISVGSETGSTTFTVLSNIEWSMSEEAEWLSAFRSNDTLITVEYNENPNEENRSAIITLSGERLSPETVFIEQSGIIVDAITVLSDPITLTIYPNPSSGKIFLKTGAEIDSETMITLFNNSGKLLYSDKFDKMLSNEIIEIDISAFNHGVYILQLKNSKFVVTGKIIKY